MKIKDVLTDHSISVSDRVIDAILFNYGINDPDPKSVNPKNQTMSKYGFSAQAYQDLADLFDLIVGCENPKAPDINYLDVSSATKIQDCIDLVTTQIAINAGP